MKVGGQVGPERHGRFHRRHGNRGPRVHARRRRATRSRRRSSAPIGGRGARRTLLAGTGFHQGTAQRPLPRPPADGAAEDSFFDDLQQEHGRFLFEELSCAKCHKPAAGDAMAKTLVDRTGPNLTEIAKRAYPGWIDAWLADPAKLRPHTTMPKMFARRRARPRRALRGHAVPRLARRASRSSRTARRSSCPNDVRQSVERGRVLYTVSGCAACHQESDAEGEGEATKRTEREPLKPEDYFYSLGTAGPAAKYRARRTRQQDAPRGARRVSPGPAQDEPRRPHAAHGPERAGSDRPRPLPLPRHGRQGAARDARRRRRRSPSISAGRSIATSSARRRATSSPRSRNSPPTSSGWTSARSSPS